MKATEAQKRRHAEARAIVDAALVGDVEGEALVALYRISAHSGRVSDPEDLIAVHVAGRVAKGKPVTDEALRDLGARYLALVVEMYKQVDACMAAERDLSEERVARATCECFRRLGECRACYQRRMI